MLEFRLASKSNTETKYLVYTQKTFDAVCLGEISREFPGEYLSFKSNKYLFHNELQEIVDKMKELNNA